MTINSATTGSASAIGDVLDGIIGQHAAVTVLRNALHSGRLSGAYLFVGPAGTGKATTAQRFAAAMCGAESETDSVYRRVMAGTHLDVRTVQPAGKSHTIHVGQLWPRGENREYPSELAMLRDLHFEPMAGPRRVFIIDGAEGLRGGNEAAGNSILKTLEEPPAYAHFILTAQSQSTLLPTIASRCQVVRFGLAAADEIEKALVGRFNVDAGRARFLSIYCEGRLGHAVVLCRSQELMAAREDLLDLAERTLTARPVEAFKMGEEIRKLAPRLRPATDISGDGAGDTEDKETSAREPILRALEMLAFYYRDLAAARAAGASDARIVNVDRRSRLSELAAKARSLESLIGSVETILGIRTAIERNAHVQGALEVLFTQLLGER
jgi:DNA polymerase III subunit delta'